MRNTRDSRKFVCNSCFTYFRPTSGTLMGYSKIPPRVWFFAMFIITQSQSGVATNFFRRELGISRPAAFRMSHAIRVHLTALDRLQRQIFSAQHPVYIDETLLEATVPEEGYGRQRVILLGMTDGKRIISQVVADRKRTTILPLIEHWVEKGATIVTDSHATYSALTKLGYSHSIVNHTRGEWKNAQGYSTSRIESYWAQLKRFIRRNYGHIMTKNIDLYVGEFNFRFNRRHARDRAFNDAIGIFEF